MGRRRRRVRVLDVGAASGSRSGLVTDIVPADHLRLHHLLEAKPARVLRLFAALQIVCLAQMEGWARLKAEHPEAAARIVAVADLMGIPEGTDDVEEGCPLCQESQS